MGDIDFDELDKAVNSLMSTNNTVGNTTAPSAGPPVAVPSGTSTPVAAATTPTTTTTATPPVAPTSRGRFMDVMPPSTQAPVTPANVTTPPVQSAPLTPSQSPVSNDTSMTQPVAVEPTTQAPFQSTEQPLSSPFLPNAQVEKRPLGGAIAPAEVPFSADESTAVPTSDAPKSDDSSTEQESDEAGAITLNGYKKPIDISGDDQRELDATNLNKKPDPNEVELAKLESHEVSETPPPTESAVTQEQASITTIESGDTERFKGGNPPQAESAPQAPATNNAHGIYDQHQPLNHPAKQKSGHWVIIAIILVIIVFISLGVAAFFVFGPGI